MKKIKKDKEERLADATKQAIMARVEATELSRTLKDKEKEAVRKYWVQRGL